MGVRDWAERVLRQGRTTGATPVEGVVVRGSYQEGDDHTHATQSGDTSYSTPCGTVAARGGVRFFTPNQITCGECREEVWENRDD